MANRKDEQVIVAVDGPAGSGKSSVCSEVAKRLGWTYLNTGAIYRAVGLLINEAGLDLSNEAELAKQVLKMASLLSWDPENNEILFQGQRLGGRLYSAEATKGASAIAKMPLVREAVLPLQRSLVTRSSKGAIVDGRDIGTVVFPNAQLKVFLTASLEERAKRRLAQAENHGSIDEIKQQIEARDNQDSERQTSPMKVADDAEVLDTSELDREAAIDRLIKMMEAKDLLS